MSPGSNNATPSKTSSTHWTWRENKVFENAIAVVPEDLPNRWEKIAAQLPGKSPEEIKDHYDALVRDVKDIESGLVELPDYRDDVEASAERVWDSVNLSSSEFRRRRSKSNRWTEEEHMLFLMGMEECGRGDWRGISRNFVVTRTPTQIANHAQKYFLRQSSTNKESRRASINDITTVDTNVVAPAIGQGGDFLRGNPAKNERTLVSFPNITTVVPPATSHMNDLLRRNFVNNNERRPASIHDIATVVVPPAIGQGGDFLCRNPANNERTLVSFPNITAVVPPATSHMNDLLRRNFVNNNERRPASIHDIATVVVPPAIGQGGDFLCRNPANNERTLVSFPNITAVVPPATSHMNDLLRRNFVNNNERRPASIHDIATVVVSPAIGQGGDFLRQNPANNERTLVSFPNITTVVPPATSHMNDLLRWNFVNNNERRIASMRDIITMVPPDNDQGSSSEVSTAATTGDQTVESSPNHFPDQTGRNGHGN